MKVLIAQDITSAGKDFLREQGYEVVLASAADEQTLCREAADCQAILVRTAPITRRIMESAPELKVIARHGVGVDAIDLVAATELGIQVTNGPLSNYQSVAEHAVALLMACAHHIVAMDSCVRRGDWESRNRVRLTEMNGKTVGIVGLGRIGQAVAAKLALGLGMKVIGYDKYVKPELLPDYVTLVDTMEQLMEQSDFVTLHCPATPETRGSINMSCFEKMKPGAFLINCARGEVVNEADLYAALTQGKLAGAGLDVLQTEPPAADNPLLKLDNVILSPHCGAHSAETFDKMGLHAAIGIHEVLSGAPVSWPVNRLG